MYKIVSGVSVIVRGWIFSNTIERITIANDALVTLFIPIIAALIIPAVSYTVAGLFYKRGDGAALGSFLYFVFDVVYTLCVWGTLELSSRLNLFTIDMWSVLFVIAGAMASGTAFIAWASMLIDPNTRGGAF
jgi:drug/metabolite transporter (DMT)-like permease